MPIATLIACLIVIGPAGPAGPQEESEYRPSRSKPAVVEPEQSQLEDPAFQSDDAGDVVDDSDDAFSFLFQVSPFTQLVSANAFGFRGTEANSDEGRLKSNFSSIPSIGLGVGFKTKPCYLDVVASGGVLSHVGSDAAIFAAHARIVGAARFRLGEKVTVGPRLGLAYFAEPNWYGDGDVEFEDSVGWLAGLGFTFGVEKISVAIDVDYIEAEFDVDPKASVITNRSQLDMSGIAVQIGVLCRF